MVISLLQVLMLLMVITSLPNLLTVWHSALYCPSNHSDINANVFENRIKHFMRPHELMLRNISIGYAIAREYRVMASIKKRRIPSAFYRLGLLYLFLNFPNLKHIAYLYNRSIAYLDGVKMKQGRRGLHSLFKCTDDMYLFLLPLFRDRCMVMVHSKSKQFSHIYYLVYVKTRLNQE